MQKVFIPLIFFLLTLSCNESNRVDTKIDPLLNKKVTWVDSLVMKYINQTNDTLIKLARRDSIPVEWMLDRTEITGTTKYLVFQIGHSFEYRFITDKWLYIDSLTRNIYEYDLSSDSLIRWPK
jgi:hypothetical protein